MHCLSKNSLDDFMVVVESAASEERFVHSYLATPYRGEFCRSTIGRVVCTPLVIRRIMRVVGHLVSSGSIPDRSTFFSFWRRTSMPCHYWQLSVHRFGKRSCRRVGGVLSCYICCCLVRLLLFLCPLVVL